MLVVCKGYKTCDRNCTHSKPHEFNNNCYLDEEELKSEPTCECSCKFLRNEKLNKLNKIYENNNL